MLQTINKYLILSLLLLTISISGCATKTNFQNTPIKNIEFKKDFSILKSNYSDIEKYSDISYLSVFALSPRPNISELKKQWGKPNEEKTEWKTYIFNIALIGGLVAFGQLPVWGLTLPFISVPTPPKTYIWNKEKYKISVPAMRSLFTGYNEQIVIWKWKEKKEK